MTWPKALVLAILVPVVLAGQPALGDPPNVACAIEPYEPVSETFRGGFGTPQVRANRLLVKASDNGFFDLACVGAFTGPYTLTVNHRYQLSTSPGSWQNLGGPEWLCSVASTNVGAFDVASILVPGSACTNPTVVFDEDDGALGYPHRFCITASAGSYYLSICTPEWVHETVG